MTKEFEFEDDGRTFTCSAETTHGTDADTWWWFMVSGKDTQRYAPFRTAAGDTQTSVRARIVAYYNHLMVRRAEPAVNYWRRRPPVAGPSPATSPTGAAGPAQPPEPETRTP